MKNLRLRHLICCCCGQYAPAYAQWWNRDTGYGYCGSCAERYHIADHDESYGNAGIHWLHANPTQEQSEREHAARLEYVRKLTNEAEAKQSTPSP